MIAFVGNPSEKCKAYRSKIETVASFICALIPSVLFAIPILYATFYWDWIFVLGLLPLFLLVVLAAKPKNAESLIFPTRICVSDTMVESQGDTFLVSRPLSAVKHIVDMGEWYQIRFFFPYKIKSPWFICQKDLLAQGTLEEFEALFEGKIIRKTQE